MTLFLHQLDLCAPLFLLVFVGWGLRKARFFTDEVGTALTGFTFRFLIPVLLFDMLSDLSKMPPVDWRVLLAFFGSCMVLFMVGKIVYPKLFKVNAAGCTILAMGGEGCISVLSNVLPREAVQLCELFFAGDVRGAAALQCRLLPVIDALFSEVNPIPVKAALAKMGYGTDTLRLPLTPMEEGSRAVLLNALEAWGV